MLDLADEIITKFRMNMDGISHNIERIEDASLNGKVKQVIGVILESLGPVSSVGDLCWIMSRNFGAIPAEVVGFKENRVLLMPLREMEGICSGNSVVATGKPLKIGVGKGLMGRVLDGLGNPIDNLGSIGTDPVAQASCLPGSQASHLPGSQASRLQYLPIINPAPPPLDRTRIKEVLPTGIRAIDTVLTLGKGQRIGIFSGSGVGKSTVLGMIARKARAEVNVIALIGERGREVLEFLEKDLGEEGLKKSVVVAVTSDKPALIRIKGALVATTIAEYFRDLGMDVLLMMDSATRVAMAQREVGLAIGEPPTTRGFTPSVFTLLPKILERTGTSKTGTITGIYTVLVEGDDMNEPIADALRSILDGHIVLSRKLAHKGHYPAIDILSSVSRVMPDIVSERHLQCAGRLKEVMAKYVEAEDLVNIGAYVDGTNPEIDYAMNSIDKINSFLTQGIHDPADWQTSENAFLSLLD